MVLELSIRRARLSTWAEGVGGGLVNTVPEVILR